MEFKPEKNNIRAIITGGLLLLDIGIIVLFFNIDSIRIKGILMFVLLLVNLYGAYYTVLLSSLIYTLNDEEFTISGAPRFRKIRVPVKEIRSWSRKISLLENLGAGFASARFALGKGVDNTGEQADLFITSSKKVIYLKTSLGNYGISPQEADEFVARLKELGIPQQSGAERHTLEPDQNRGRGSLNQMTLYCILLTAILLLLPLMMHFTGLLPPLVQISNTGYVTRMNYLESVLTRGLVSLLLMLGCYGVVTLLSAIEGKFYHRIMFIPLIFVVVLLFIEINTQITVLLG